PARAAVGAVVVSGSGGARRAVGSLPAPWTTRIDARRAPHVSSLPGLLDCDLGTNFLAEPLHHLTDDYDRCIARPRPPTLQLPRMGLNVVAARLGHRGTDSMREAPNMLDFGPRRHVLQVNASNEQKRLWRAHARCDSLG